jgi:protein gp37
MPIKRSGVGYADFSGGDANHIIGCTPISAGCANCYARVLIEDRGGRDFSEVKIYPKKLNRLLRAEFQENGKPFRRGPGSRPIIFPVDLGDHFHEDVLEDYLFEVLNVYWARDDADWLVLTKRPMFAGQRIAKWLCDVAELERLPAHIWIGATIENERAFGRIYDLLSIPAERRWLSLEPMLEPLAHLFWQYTERVATMRDTIHWIVVGAESGPKRRPFDEDWARDMRDFCTEYGIPFYYKQGSHRFPGRNDVLDGRRWKEFPGLPSPIISTRAGCIEL